MALMGPGYYLYFSIATEDDSEPTFVSSGGHYIVPGLRIPFRFQESEDDMLAEIITSIIVAEE